MNPPFHHSSGNVKKHFLNSVFTLLAVFLLIVMNFCIKAAISTCRNLQLFSTAEEASSLLVYHYSATHDQFLEVFSLANSHSWKLWCCSHSRTKTEVHFCSPNTDISSLLCKKLSLHTI